MLSDLHTQHVPNWDLQGINLSGQNWDILKELWNRYGSKKIQFSYTDDPMYGPSWVISEELSNKVHFQMVRERFFNKRRNTQVDLYGVLGLSLINPKDTRVILTEGVSDYFTAKLLCPNNNVLGMTTLSGSSFAKRFVLSVFDKIIICADNDCESNRNTGMLNSMVMKEFYQRFGKEVKVFIPPMPSKDITDALVFNLRLING